KDENAGASMGLDYNTRMGKWELQSLNSFSTESYAGLNRGSFFFNQRIGREFAGSKRAFLVYQKSRVRPQYLNNQNAYNRLGFEEYRNYFYSTEAVKLGYQFSMHNWSFLFSPQVVK